MKTYYSLEQDAPVSYAVVYYEEIAANHAYGGSGVSVSDILAQIEVDPQLDREIAQAVADRIIED